MTRQELDTLLGRLLREYRAALLADFYNEQGAKQKLDESKNDVLCAVRKTKRFAYYSFSDLPWRAYKIVSKKKEGESDFIGALNRYLENCALSIQIEVRKVIDTRKAEWNFGTELTSFRKLSEEYRALFENHIHSREKVEAELRSIGKRLIAIYIHPKMYERSLLRCILMDAVAKPTSNEEATNDTDAALSREGFALLEKLHNAFKTALKEQLKKPR
jgi:hypothetical protein